MPSNSVSKSSSESVGDAAPADLALAARVVGVEAHQRRHVERDRQPALSVLEQEPVPRVRLRRRAEAGELPHRPERAPVHRGVDAARERERARRAQPLGGVPAVEVVGAVDGLGIGSPDSVAVRPLARRLAVVGCVRGRRSRGSSPAGAVEDEVTPRPGAASMAAARVRVEAALGEIVGEARRRRAARRRPRMRTARPPGSRPRGAGALGASRRARRTPPGASRWRLDRVPELIETLALRRRGGEHRRIPVAGRARGAASGGAPATTSPAPSRSALFTTKTSATSRMPAFAICTASPSPARARRRPCRWRRRRRPRPGRPRPSPRRPRRSRPRRGCRTASGAASAMPPRCPRVAIDRMNTPGSVACSCMRTRSPEQRAPRVRARSGRPRARRPRVARPRPARTSPAASVDFPTPGAPVSPTVAARPVRAIDARGERLRGPGRRPRPARSRGRPRGVPRQHPRDQPVDVHRRAAYPSRRRGAVRSGRRGAGDRLRARRGASGSTRAGAQGQGRRPWPPVTPASRGSPARAADGEQRGRPRPRRVGASRAGRRAAARAPRAVRTRRPRCRRAPPRPRAPPGATAARAGGPTRRRAPRTRAAAGPSRPSRPATISQSAPVHGSAGKRSSSGEFHRKWANTASAQRPPATSRRRPQRLGARRETTYADPHPDRAGVQHVRVQAAREDPEEEPLQHPGGRAAEDAHEVEDVLDDREAEPAHAPRRRTRP